MNMNYYIYMNGEAECGFRWYVDAVCICEDWHLTADIVGAETGEIKRSYDHGELTYKAD